MSTASVDSDKHGHGTRPIGVTPAKAAALLDCSISMIYKLLRNGKLDSFTLLGGRRITTESIEQLVNGR